MNALTYLKSIINSFKPTVKMLNILKVSGISFLRESWKPCRYMEYRLTMYRKTRDGSCSLSTVGGYTGLMSEVMVVSGEEAGGLVSGGGVEGGGAGFSKTGGGASGDGFLMSGEAEAGGGGGDCLVSGCEAGGGSGGLLIPGEAETGLCSVPPGASFVFPSFFFTILSSSLSSFFLLSRCPVE